MGSPWAFAFAACLIIGWAMSGPFFHFSDTWELVINTATTIITFLMVFLIQNTQNRDARAMHLKMDELIYSIHKADNKLLDIEELSPHELDALALKYKKLAHKVEATHKEKLRGKKD